MPTTNQDATPTPPDNTPDHQSPEDTPANGEEIITSGTEHPPELADLYSAIEGLGEGRINVHVGAERALTAGSSTVLLSMGLARAYQRVLRLTEWSGASANGARCPVCRCHRVESSRGGPPGPNRGHAAACPLRKGLDNLNRAIGITNRGRSQGPAGVLMWDGAQRNEAEAPPELWPNPLSPEGVAFEVLSVQHPGNIEHAEDAPLTFTAAELSKLLRLWSTGGATETNVQRLLTTPVA